jgi:hypothetical protein
VQRRHVRFLRQRGSLGTLTFRNAPQTFGKPRELSRQPIVSSRQIRVFVGQCRIKHSRESFSAPDSVMRPIGSGRAGKKPKIALFTDRRASVLIQIDFDDCGVFSHDPDCELHFPIASVRCEQRISSSRNIVKLALEFGGSGYSNLITKCNWRDAFAEGTRASLPFR